MSQHDMIIDNAVGATVRTDINAALAALVSNSSGAAEPATMYANMIWMDTTDNVLKKRNASNTAWIALSGGLVSVTSAASPDIFGALGETISINNSTPVTATSFAACLSEQVGTTRKVIPAQNWSVTASANLVVDGATSGTYVMPANAHLEVRAETTTKFILTTILASGTWTPNQGAGLTVVGAFSSTGRFTKVGNEVTLFFSLLGATSIAVTAAGALTSNAPFTCPLFGLGALTNGNNTASVTNYIGGTTIYSNTAIAATSGIYGTVSFQV